MDCSTYFSRKKTCIIGNAPKHLFLWAVLNRNDTFSLLQRYSKTYATGFNWAHTFHLSSCFVFLFFPQVSLCIFSLTLVSLEAEIVEVFHIHLNQPKCSATHHTRTGLNISCLFSFINQSCWGKKKTKIINEELY